MDALGYNEHSEVSIHYGVGKGCRAILYQQAFRWFREKYGFTFSIGKTNISVVHVPTTTQLLQNNANYEAAELTTIKYFIEIAKQIPF